MRYPKEIILVRHGESEGNILTCDERSVFNLSTKDYPLTEKGKEQSKVVGKYLQKRYKNYDVSYVSFCKRTKQTMSIMFSEKEEVFCEDSRLSEVQRGIWHTMSQEEVDENFPYEDRRRKREGLYYYRPLGGENWPDLEIRIYNFIEYLCREYSGKRVLLCVHGHWLIVFQKIIHKFTIEEALRRYRDCTAPNGSVTIYKYKNNSLQLTRDSFIPSLD